MLPLKDDIPSRRIPLITVGLILLNVAVFVYQQMLGPFQESFIWKFGAVARSIVTFNPIHPDSTLFPPLTLVTAQFLHGGFMHLAGNMLFLWIFGDNVEDRLGHFRFLVFYVCCGILAVIAQVIISPGAEVPIIGASGAIAGVMGAYLIRFPHARIYTLIFVFFFVRIVSVPALVFLGFWFIFQLLVGAPSIGDSGGGVAYFAHIGGFLSGMVLFKILEKD